MNCRCQQRMEEPDWIEDLPGLKQRLQELNATSRNKNEEEQLNLAITAAWFDREALDLLWSILFHPRSSIVQIGLSEESPDALATTGVMKPLKAWCKACRLDDSSRKIWLDNLDSDDTERTRETLDDLLEALTYPANQVHSLSLLGYSPIRGPCICNSLLRPVLENLSNKLRNLRLGDDVRLDADAAASLSLAFQSPYCKLERLEITNFSCLGFVSAQSILQSLQMNNSLQRLALEEPDPTWENQMTEKRRSILLTQIARWLEKSGNQLRCVSWKMDGLNQDQVALLARSLKSEHCRLEELVVYDAMMKPNVALPLVAVLCHPNNRLDTLMGHFTGKEAFTVLGECLNHPNCKLKFLMVQSVSDGNEGQEREMESLAEVLSIPNTVRLETLLLGRQSEGAYRAFSKSLRSPYNHLTGVGIHGINDIDEGTRQNFYRAVRISNIVEFWDDQDPGAFAEAFNQNFLWVLYTLLSIRLVPRLGQLGWIRLLPVEDLILRIADTLGWPLDDLRV